MKCVSVFLIIGLCAGWGSAQFLNNRPFPTYSLENMPNTEFTCRDKILGGYYADAETQCQMFHVCVKVAGVGVQDFRFLCPNGTAFDQDHQICADWEDVDCDATTLYYSSDNFDLYRLGSGFESKAVKYGEDEETFALQRAETGDARLNREHQSQRVNQQREPTNPYYRNDQNSHRQHNNNNNNQNNARQNSNNNNNDRDIFKGSSSSNFYNNRNNGKENDEDYDDNVNVNQNRDPEQKRKIVRKQQRRPVQQQTEEPQRIRKPEQNQNQNQNQNRNQNQYDNQNRNQNQNQNQYDNQNRNQNQNQNYQVKKRPVQQQQQHQQQNEEQTQRPQRPTGFVNNFAGSSYIPTTSRPSSTTINAEQFTTAVNNFRTRNGQGRQRVQGNFNENTQNTNVPSPSYTVSTPAPFRQTQQYNNPPVRANTQSQTENYPSSVPQKANYPSSAAPQNYNTQYDVPKIKPNKQPTTQFGKTENYPSNNPQYFDKKPTTPVKQTDNYPTTFSPKTKINPQGFQANKESFPTTFAPRTNAGYTQITQQTTQYNKNTQTAFQQPSSFKTNPAPAQKSTPQYSPSTFQQQQRTQTQAQTQRTTPFTQYTPTVPKVTSTTPVSRSNRFDETQYDDGSYNSKYDDKHSDDEFLKTAHSQNIASSRNEFAKTTKVQQQSTQTQKPYFESPRPFSVSSNTPTKVTHAPAPPQVKQQAQPQQQTKPAPVKTGKKVKDVSYDYAYYDTNVGSDPDYEIDTEFKKSTVKN